MKNTYFKMIVKILTINGINYHTINNRIIINILDEYHKIDAIEFVYDYDQTFIDIVSIDDCKRPLSYFKIHERDLFNEKIIEKMINKIKELMEKGGP